jgi:6-phosphogluconate dehydrogenase
MQPKQFWTKLRVDIIGDKAAFAYAKMQHGSGIEYGEIDL